MGTGAGGDDGGADAIPCCLHGLGLSQVLAAIRKQQWPCTVCVPVLLSRGHLSPHLGELTAHRSGWLRPEVGMVSSPEKAQCRPRACGAAGEKEVAGELVALEE